MTAADACTEAEVDAGVEMAVTNARRRPRPATSTSRRAVRAQRDGRLARLRRSVGRLSFGYTTNRPGSGLGLNERGQSLVDTV
jgi:hypothetical protein